MRFSRNFRSGFFSDVAPSSPLRYNRRKALRWGSVRKREEQNVSEQQNRETLERFFETFEHQDPLAFVEFLHDDYIEEFPQSGERIRGKDNWRKIKPRH